MKTLREYPYEAGRTLYPVDFQLGILSRDHVYVYVGDVFSVQVGYTWINDGQISLNEPIQEDEVLTIRRIVPKSELINDYENGARLSEQNLDDSFKQALMILEELADGLISEVDPWIINTVVQFNKGAIFKDNLDMDGNRIINLGDPINDTDAVNFQTLKNYIPVSDNECILISGDLGFIFETATLEVDFGSIENPATCFQDLGFITPTSTLKAIVVKTTYGELPVSKVLDLPFSYLTNENQLDVYINGSFVFDYEETSETSITITGVFTDSSEIVVKYRLTQS